MSTPAERSDTAANIRAEMARQKISGRELARRLGEAPMWVQRRVAGTGPITVEELARIASVLGVPAADLLGEQRATA